MNRGWSAWMAQVRSNTEREQALVRILIEAVLTFYLIGLFLRDASLDGSETRTLLVAAGFLVVAVFIFLESGWERFTTRTQRLPFAAVNDALGISLTILLIGHAGLLAFGVYLWVTFGYGFRYGRKALFLSQLLNLIGFSVVASYSPFLRGDLVLVGALYLMLAVLPLYAAHLIQRLHEESAAARGASKAKSAFLANMSHEIRTPLNGILGAKQLLEETALNAEQRDLVQTLSASSEALLAVINDVLDVSKIEAGKILARPVPYQLRELVGKCVSMFSPMARAKGLQFNVEVDAAVPDLLLGDADFIRQICANLLGNAIKFTESGAVAIQVSVVDDAGQALRFEVSDTGIGIASSAQAHIFESFYQGDASSTRKYGGSGLGTAICKGLVEAMGGSIGLRSELNVGSTFWFTVPLVLAQSSNTPPRVVEDVKVLLASDDGALVAGLRRDCQSWGVAARIVNPHELTAQVQGGAGALQDVHLLVLDAPTASTLSSSIWRNLHQHLPDHTRLALLRRTSTTADPPAVLRARCVAQLDVPVDKRTLFALLHQCMAQHELALKPALIPLPAPPARGGHVLLAEDNSTNQKILTAMLEKRGYQVSVANDGEHALDTLAQGSFDVVIVDIMMPKRNGLDVTKALRFMELGARRTPVIVLTADAASDVAKKCEEAGADAYLTKPVDAKLLYETVERLLAGLSVLPATAPQPSVEHFVSTQQIVDPSRFAEACSVSAREGFATELADGFAQDCKATLGAMYRCLTEQRYHELRDHAHAIKGGASSLGAIRTLELCRQLQRLSPADLERRAAALVNQLDHELAACVAELTRLSASYKSSKAH